MDFSLDQTDNKECALNCELGSVLSMYPMLNESSLPLSQRLVCRSEPRVLVSLLQLVEDHQTLAISSVAVTLLGAPS